MTALAIDFFGARPNPQAVKAAGYMAVLFYLRSPADPKAYISAGLGVGTIFEYLADESLQGAAKGTADGKLAVQQMTALGQPKGTVHAVNLADFAPTPSEVPAIRAYWEAYLAETSAWHVIPYGTAWLLQALNINGWQNAMNDNGVVGSAVVPQAVVYQRTVPTLHVAGTAAGEYDEDVILAPLPWWGLSQPPAAPVVTPANPLKEVTMFLANDGKTQFIVCESANGLVKHPLPGGLGSELALLSGVIPNQPTAMPTVLSSIPSAFTVLPK